MNWHRSTVSESGTHHEVDGVALYDARFDRVLSFHAPGIAAVRAGSEAWHIFSDGSPAYARRFRRTFGFYEGAAAVESEGWHHIRPDGSDLHAERFAWCGNYQEGRCVVRTAGGDYFHVDQAGSPAYALKWRYVGDFRGGIAVVQSPHGESTHIDPQGSFLHGSWFLDLDVFHKGFARARDNNGWMHVDKTGKPAYRRRFAMVEPFYNEQARVEAFDGKLEVIDENGATLATLREAGELPECRDLTSHEVQALRRTAQIDHEAGVRFFHQMLDNERTDRKKP